MANIYGVHTMLNDAYKTPQLIIRYSFMYMYTHVYTEIYICIHIYILLDICYNFIMSSSSFLFHK